MLDEIISYIARTNLFNFLIFLSIIIFLYKKINVTEKLECAKNDVKETIQESENTKTESETRLSEIEESMTHIEEEVEAILTEADNRAKLVGEKILEDANLYATTVHANMEKALDNSRAALKNDIIKRAANASIEAAKAHIISELNNNQDLHHKLIDESIEALEGIQL